MRSPANRSTADVQASDALLLGRTTYDIFRAYWPGKTDEIGRAFDRVPKYVASRGTPELSWDTSTQITDVGAEVRDLRERHEQIHTWGSANLLQTLFREALVDQVNLWVCPVVIGQGKKLFPEGTAATRFEQVEPPRSYPGGAMLLRYRCLEGPRRRGTPSEPGVQPPASLLRTVQPTLQLPAPSPRGRRAGPARSRAARRRSRTPGGCR